MQQDINELLQSIYDEYQKPLRVMAIHLGVAEKDVDDIVQETIIAYYANYPLDLKPMYKTAMLGTIIRNKSIDYFRKFQKERVIFNSGEFVEDQEMALRFGHNLMDQIISEELYQDVKRAIEKLSEDLREAARLHLIEEYTEKETAKILGISDVACRARISRARKLLRKSLGPKYDF